MRCAAVPTRLTSSPTSLPSYRSATVAPSFHRTIHERAILRFFLALADLFRHDVMAISKPDFIYS